jgi:hypothetical protein
LANLTFYSAVNSDGNPYWTMKDTAELAAGENLFYYNETTDLFYIKTLPAPLATQKMGKFTKIGDYVYGINVATGYATIWKYSTGVVETTGSATVTDVKSDGQMVYYTAAADLHSVTISASPTAITQELTKINEMTAYLGTLGASLAIVDFAVFSPYVVFLNYDATYNTILSYEAMMKWVIT